MEITDIPKLKTHQKRAMFKARFGKLLKEQGFHYYKNRFIRFHEGQILLNVRMELSHTGEMNVCFGGIPLCAEGSNPALPFGEKIADFGRIYPLPPNFRRRAFGEQLEAQAELFEKYLLEPFAEIDSVASLLDYQERVLEDRLSLMPADLAAWECVCLRDYERAARYAALWEKLEQDYAEKRAALEKAAIMAEDLNRHDREIRLRDHRYRCKCRKHNIYAAQRFGHLIELGAYPLLQERIRSNIAAAEAAFYKYRHKE